MNLLNYLHVIICIHFASWWSAIFAFDPCANQTCIFNCNTNSECRGETIICSNAVNRCKIICSWEFSCKEITIFSAAVTTTIAATANMFSFGDANVFCGSFESQSFWNNLYQNYQLNFDINTINKSSLVVSETGTNTSVYQQCILSCNATQVLKFRVLQ